MGKPYETEKKGIYRGWGKGSSIQLDRTVAFTALFVTTVRNDVDVFFRIAKEWI